MTWQALERAEGTGNSLPRPNFVYNNTLVTSASASASSNEPDHPESISRDTTTCNDGNASGGASGSASEGVTASRFDGVSGSSRPHAPSLEAQASNNTGPRGEDGTSLGYGDEDDAVSISSSLQDITLIYDRRLRTHSQALLIPMPLRSRAFSRQSR